MSAEAMRAETKRLIAAAIQENMVEMVGRTGETAEQLRIFQGTVMGLRIAVNIVDTAYKNLGN